MTQTQGPLSGVRIVEVSSFVAAPLCGLTLSQLGAEVIRIDPIGGASDYKRWPVTDTGESIYWTGLNKGKRSLSVDMRAERGQELIRQLVTAPGPGGGILVTNAGGRTWMSHDSLAQLRSDVITLEVLGRRDGSPGGRLHGQRRVGIPTDHRPRGLRRSCQSRLAGLGRRVRALRRPVDHCRCAPT